MSRLGTLRRLFPVDELRKAALAPIGRLSVHDPLAGGVVKGGMGVTKEVRGRLLIGSLANLADRRAEFPLDLEIALAGLLACPYPFRRRLIVGHVSNSFFDRTRDLKSSASRINKPRRYRR